MSNKIWIHQHWKKKTVMHETISGKDMKKYQFQYIGPLSTIPDAC